MRKAMSTSMKLHDLKGLRSYFSRLASKTGGIATPGDSLGVDALATLALPAPTPPPHAPCSKAAHGNDRQESSPAHKRVQTSSNSATSSEKPTPSLGSITATPDKPTSTTLAVSAHCPPSLHREHWAVKDFDLRALLYNGNISMVYHAVDRRSGITIALKLYKLAKLTTIERHQVTREIRLHIDLAHPSIIGMYAAWRDRHHVYMAIEWASGGDVYSYLRHNHGPLSEAVAVPLILEPFMSGMAALHEQGLIHRDIKPENILLNHASQIKIADFGLSIDSRQEVPNTRLGTIDYLAPEILLCPVKQTPFDNKENPNIGYTNKVDCWSCGVLVYELLTGQAPFASNTPNETLRLIRTKDVHYPPELSKMAVDFMQQLLVRDPNKRLSIKEALEHPWIAQFSRRQRNRMGPSFSHSAVGLQHAADVAKAGDPALKQQVQQQQVQQAGPAPHAAKQPIGTRTATFLSLPTSTPPSVMASRVPGLTLALTVSKQASRAASPVSKQAPAPGVALPSSSHSGNDTTGQAVQHPKLGKLAPAPHE